MAYPRVAFLPDTFHEVNGVAHTSRHLEAYARRRQLPFLSVHAGPANKTDVDGSVTILELARGPAKFGLDANLDYDPFLLRHAGRVQSEFEKFKPDLIHLTGPGDMGTLGCYLAKTMKLPLVISWHTSLHQYAGRRLEKLAGFLGGDTSQAIGTMAEDFSLLILQAFYRQAEVVLAPNQELIEMTRALTQRPVYLMQRGVDTKLFDPAKRSRLGGPFRVGYVGRLTPEKNVRLLAEIGGYLQANGLAHLEIVVIGEGSEREWLSKNVPNIKLKGVLRGEALAMAYADMDLFAFPSTTDTFGNVILEALGSGVPAVVTGEGGPKFLVSDGITGYIAKNDQQFLESVLAIARSFEMHARMGLAAREFALKQSWDCVFEGVYAAYALCLPAVRAA